MVCNGQLLITSCYVTGCYNTYTASLDKLFKVFHGVCGVVVQPGEGDAHGGGERELVKGGGGKEEREGGREYKRVGVKQVVCLIALV